VVWEREVGDVSLTGHLLPEPGIGRAGEARDGVEQLGAHPSVLPDPPFNMDVHDLRDDDVHTADDDRVVMPTLQMRGRFGDARRRNGRRWNGLQPAPGNLVFFRWKVRRAQIDVLNERHRGDVHHELAGGLDIGERVLAAGRILGANPGLVVSRI
jgi:hypothetical protein